MVNPFAIGWLWRGFKGNSVTFALLFASFVVGLSLSHYVNVLLTKAGSALAVCDVISAFFFMWLAKREDQIISNEAKHKLWARADRRFHPAGASDRVAPKMTERAD